jgi:hypothetical protein
VARRTLVCRAFTIVADDCYNVAGETIMTDMEQLKKRLNETASIQNTLDRRIAVAAVITAALQTIGVKPILVGGAAVEFYTLGGYATTDIDMVSDWTSKVKSIMLGLGFTLYEDRRHWEHADLDIFLEMPMPPLDGDLDRVLELDFDGLPLYVIAIEDIVIDRVCAFKNWKSKQDGRWARRLMHDQSDRIDWAYLVQRAKELDVEAELDRLREGDEEI